MGGRSTVRIARVYDEPDPGEGARVLVDRLWPRGLSKDLAKVDLWLKDVAPSDALRRDFHAHPGRWEAFRKAYRSELEGNPALAELRTLARKQRITLLFAARDERHNNAVVLEDLL